MSRKSKTNQTANTENTIVPNEEQSNQETTSNEESSEDSQDNVETSSAEVETQAETSTEVDQKEPEVDTAPVVEKEVNVVKEQDTAAKPSSTTEKTVFEKMRERIIEKGTFGEKLVVEYFDNYISVMRPGLPVDETTGARQQQNLWKIIHTSINNEADFKKCMDAMMGYFREHAKGAFYDTHIYRFAEFTNLGDNQRRSFNGITTLFKIAATTKSKKDIRSQIDISRAVDGVFDEPARQRIMAYFN